MSSKGKAQSPILEAVHETATDLHRLGFIDKRKMRELDALCLAIKVPTYDAEKIRSIRERYRLSQAVLASILNTSLSTVRQWEIGKKSPSGPSRKLLNILDRKGLETLIQFLGYRRLRYFCKLVLRKTVIEHRSNREGLLNHSAFYAVLIQPFRFGHLSEEWRTSLRRFFHGWKRGSALIPICPRSGLRFRRNAGTRWQHLGGGLRPCWVATPTRDRRR